MKPTLTLMERCPGEGRLTRDDVAFLLEHASHLRLSPTRQEGIYRLQPTRLMGVLEAPSCRIIIRPKLPLRTVAFLLDPDARLPPYESAGLTPDVFGLLDLLVLLFTQRIAQQARLGWQHGYREEATASRYLQGRPDVAAQMQDLPRRDLLHGRHEEWSADMACNQLLRSSLELLLRSVFLSETLRHRVEQSLLLFEGITSIVPNREAFSRAMHVTPSYRPLLELAQSVVEGLMPLAGVSCSGTAFLLDLERLFERWVSRGIREYFEPRGFIVHEQHTIALPPLQLRPDLIVGKGSDVHLVVDTKWKRVRPGRLKPADFYQVMGYAMALLTERVFLVYPDRRDTAWTMDLPRPSPRVEVRTLRVTSTPARNWRSLQRLARSFPPVNL